MLAEFEYHEALKAYIKDIKLAHCFQMFDFYKNNFHIYTDRQSSGKRACSKKKRLRLLKLLQTLTKFWTKSQKNQKESLPIMNLVQTQSPV